MEKKLAKVLSFSGGKDSTACALLALDTPALHGVDCVINFQTGYDYPEVEETVQVIKKRFQDRGIPFYIVRMGGGVDNIEGLSEKCVARLNELKSFYYYIHEHKKIRGRLDIIGYGLPNQVRRWCTSFKNDSIDLICNSLFGEYIRVVGFARDELGRTMRINAGKRNRHCTNIFPLVDVGFTERDALYYCYDHGITWRGLYEHIDRASCYCCPLQSLKQFRYLWEYRPELFENIKSLYKDKQFLNKRTIFDYEKRFALEKEYERQGLPTNTRRFYNELNELTGFGIKDNEGQITLPL